MPVAVTLSLLLMARKMSRNRVLVKNLTTIETLSCVNVIASDKTGTLTQNKMFVGSVSVNNKDLNIKECHTEDAKHGCAINQFVATCLLCNNAKFDEDELEVAINQRKANGDATDIALLRFGEENMHFHKIENNYTVLSEIPFNSKNKWMMKFVEPKDLNSHRVLFGEKESSNKIVFIKGAPDYLLKKAQFVLNEDGSQRELDDETYNEIIKLQTDWCNAGRRVLLLMKKHCSDKDVNFLMASSSIETERFVHQADDFCVVGMAGIIDPPREGIVDVVNKCRTAGIRVMMVTGNYL